MRFSWRFSFFIFLLFPLKSFAFQIGDTGSAQLVVVTAPDWASLSGEMRLYEKQGDTWVKSGEAKPIVVGKNGMAWGLGLVDVDLEKVPRKAEGDLKAPAGVFNLSTVMGTTKHVSLNTKMPYAGIRTDLECVDDPASKFYNQLALPEMKKEGSWTSSEKMFRRDGLYYHLIVVDHNKQNQPGKGSCIFFHIWRDATKGTAGCTATDRETLISVIEWLDPAKKPVLVQMPKGEYESRRVEWGLPVL